MPAGRAVGATAGAELDLAAVEVFLELGPLLRRGVAVSLFRADVAPLAQMASVVADDVLVEDGDVVAGGLDVEVAHQSRADVDGQSTVHQFGGEDSP